MKRIALIVITSIFYLSSEAQIDNFIKKFSDEKNFISEAVRPCLYLVNQEYILQSTSQSKKQAYGRDSLTYFGRFKFLGINTNKGLLTSRKILSPWEGDENFLPFRGTDTLQPIVGKTEIRRITDSVYQSLTYQDYGIMEPSLVNLKALKGLQDSSSLEIDSIMPSSAWVVLVYQTESDSNRFMVTSYKTELKQSEKLKQRYTLKTMPQMNHIFGGIIITPRFLPGLIRFGLNGILFESDNTWYAISFHAKESNLNSVKTSRLNPIDGSEKNIQPSNK